MPPEFLTPAHADTIVQQLFRWLVDEPRTTPDRVRAQLSLVACIICDSASADITLQPLHDAYARAKAARQLDVPAPAILTPHTNVRCEIAEVANVYDPGRPWVVRWQTQAMPAPSFTYFATEAEAKAVAATWQAAVTQEAP